MKTSSSHTSDKDDAVLVVGQLVAGLLTGFTVEPASLVAGKVTDFVVSVTLANPLPVDASIFIFLPQILSGSSTWDGNVTVEASSFDGTIDFVESSPGIVNITRLNNGNETPAGTNIKVKISHVEKHSV